MIAPVSVARSTIAARLEAVLRVPEHVGEHQPPLGVGVDHLDGVALHRAHHVARTLRLAVGHVLDQPDQPDDVGRRLAQRQRPHHPGDDAGAAHVHRHLLHARRGLDRDAAGVEHHPLADQRQRRRVAAALPLHDHDLRRALRALRRPRAACASRARRARARPAPRPRRRAPCSPVSRSANSVVVSTFAGSLVRSRVKYTPSACAASGAQAASLRLGRLDEEGGGPVRRRAPPARASGSR